jgi:hypothetical protein
VTYTSNPGAPAYPPPPGVGYPPPPPPAQGSKVAASWTGVVMAIGALLAAIGAFLPYEKIVVFLSGRAIGTVRFTGIGSITKTGHPSLPPLKAGNSGKIVLVLGILLLVAAVLILAKMGRIWVGIVSLVMALFAVIMSFASFAAPKSDSKDLNALAADGYSTHGLVKVGVELSVAGAIITAVAALLAIIVRRRRTAR